MHFSSSFICKRGSNESRKLFEQVHERYVMRLQKKLQFEERKQGNQRRELILREVQTLDYLGATQNSIGVGQVIRRERKDSEIRTKEQLGYVVECSPRVTYRVFGFCLCVQSSEYNPVYLQGRIENFLNGLEELLDGLDGDSFENYKSGLMAKLLEKDPSLTYESNRFWSQIVEKRYIFDLSKKEAEELKNISKHDVVEWYKTYLKPSSPKCRQLLIRLWGCNTDLKEAEALPKSVQAITDPAAFKMQSKFYPSFC